MDLEATLERQPFFKGLKPKFIKLLAGHAKNIHFEGGQILFNEGQVANRFYLITHGKVSVEVFTPKKGPVTLETISEGDAIGWSWLVPPYKWQFDTRAATLTRTIAIDAKAIRKVVEKDTEFGYEIHRRVGQVIARRLQSTRMQLIDIYGD